MTTDRRTDGRTDRQTDKPKTIEAGGSSANICWRGTYKAVDWLIGLALPNDNPTMVSSI